MKNFDVIRNTAGFDADWYGDVFADAAAMQLSPEAHYRAVGYRLGRGVSSGIPSLAEAPDLAAALSRTPRVSYCTPIMNRGDDLRATLRRNLEENREFAELLEFVVVFLDEDHETHNWLRSEFSTDLATGYLRALFEPPLDGWHFGKAKNRHRAYAIGSVYSSLDGDNFVSADETRQLLEVAETYPGGFVFHHFTGVWGDGTSGRISMPMRIYRAIGYDESFLPRQYDEMDVLLSAMSTWPDLPLIQLETDNPGFAGRRSQQFLEAAQVSNPVVRLEPPHRQGAINAKAADYVQADPLMEAMTAYNQGVSFARNAPTADLRQTYVNLAVKGRHKVIDALPRDGTLTTLFSGAAADLRKLEALRDLGPDEVCVLACMKNDDAFLEPFYRHYKALGAAHFLIVDDGSETPIRDSLPYEDVHVMRPKVGSFVTAKGMWLEGLMKACLKPGGWALTVDADEFLDLPDPYATLPELTGELARRNQVTMPGLLIDMVPGPGFSDSAMADNPQAFATQFDHYGFVQGPVGEDYAQISSIDWAFGPYKALSWALDTRYHAFGTVDSLRKIPLIRWREGRHLNQGFHTLLYTDDTAPPRTEIWDTDLLLPIRHYKLCKLYTPEARARMAAHVAQSEHSPYHARTTANISRIFGEGAQDPRAAIAEVPCRPYSDGALKRLDPRSFRVEDAGDLFA